jgi:hypothetical protein
MFVKDRRIVRIDGASLSSGLGELQFTMSQRMDRKDETNISTKLDKEEKRTRVSGTDALEKGSEHTEPKTSERTARTDGE